MAEPENKLAVVAAGGTGGHLFPAEALSHALVGRGWRVALATDARAEGMSGRFPAERRIILSAATFRPGDLAGVVPAALAIFKGVRQARREFAQANPAIVIGFGGYPSLPSLIAALSQGRATLIHEQNAVMGRANRLLAPRVTALACAFPILKKAPASAQARAEVVGNPVRPDVQALFSQPYPVPTATGVLQLLVTGGSQGARLLSEGAPKAVGFLPRPLRERLKVAQQARPEALDAARAAYADAGVDAEVSPFFSDMAAKLAAAHLVIGRAGASTVSELAVAGRPAILTPLGIALDNDQGWNARVLADAGGAEVILESVFSPALLAERLEALLSSPDRLAAMAGAARSMARPDAADRLADLVEATAASRGGDRPASH